MSSQDDFQNIRDFLGQYDNNRFLVGGVATPRRLPATTFDWGSASDDADVPSILECPALPPISDAQRTSSHSSELRRGIPGPSLAHDLDREKRLQRPRGSGAHHRHLPQVFQPNCEVPLRGNKPKAVVKLVQSPDGEPRDGLNTLTTSTLQEVMPRAAWAHNKRSDLPLNLKFESEGHSLLSDDAMSESHSPWTSDYSEDPPELDHMHPLRLVKPDLLRQVLLAFQTWRHHQNEGTGASNSASPSTFHTGDATDRPGGAPNEGGPAKRKESGDHDEEGERGLGTRPNKKRRCISQGLSFACPFAKKDPLKHKKCYTKTITRIQDVKLHLAREHQIPIHCPRCKASFKTQGLLYHHAEGSLCQPRHEPVYEGVNADQKALLKQRVSAKLSLEGQWFSVFDILFPGHQPRPLSPYVDSRLHIEIRAFHDMMLAEGPRLFNEVLESHGYSMTAANMEGDLTAANMEGATAANMEGDLTMLRELVVADALQAITNRWLAGICPEPSPSQEGQDRVQDLSSVGPASASSSTLHLTGPYSGTRDPASVDDRPTDAVSSPARSSEQSGPHPNQATGVLTEPGMEQLPCQSHPSSANYHEDLVSDIADAMWPDTPTSLVAQPLVMNDIAADIDPDYLNMSEYPWEDLLDFNNNGKLGFGGDLGTERHEPDPNP